MKSSSQPENLHQFNDDDIDDDNDSSSLSSPCSSSSSEMLSSDEMLSSSYSSKYSSLPRKSSLRSFRSVDSLTSLQQKREKEQDLLNSMDLSQSLTDDLARLEDQPEEIPVPARGIYKTMECLSEIPTPQPDEVKTTEDTKTVVRRSTENLSEDSGFGDHVVSVAKKHEGEGGGCGSSSSSTSEGSNTVERENNRVEGADAETRAVDRPPRCDGVDEEQREEEEEATEADRERNDAKFNQQCWQSDPNLLDCTYVIETETETTSPCSQQSEECSSTMSSRLPVVSTPNLYNTDEEYHYKGTEDVVDGSLCNESTVSLSRIYSLKRINFGSEGKLSTTSSRGSNVQITTSFINLTNSNYGSNKGVHFCPVVSEVSWQESSGSDEEDDEEEEISISESDSRGDYSAGDEEEIRRPRYSRRVERIKEEEAATTSEERDVTPPIDELVSKLLLESVSKQARESDKEKLRQAQQRARLDFITSPPPKRGSIAHVMQHTTTNAANNNNNVVNNYNRRPSTNQVYCGDETSTSHHSNATVSASSAANSAIAMMDSSVAGANGGIAKEKSSSKSSSSSSVSKIGGFLQRFSLKRLSGRKKSKKSSSAPPVVVGCVPKDGYNGTYGDEPNSRIIPLSDDGEQDHGAGAAGGTMVSSKPPLPPSAPARRRPSADGDPAPPRSAAVQQCSSQQLVRGGGDSNTPNMLRNTHAIDPNTGIGLLETDIDSNVTSSTSAVNRAANSPSGNKKSRSLLNLDNGRMSIKQLTPDDRAKPSSPHHTCNDYRAKSMEFLLDKENQAAVKVSLPSSILRTFVGNLHCIRISPANKLRSLFPI